MACGVVEFLRVIYIGTEITNLRGKRKEKAKVVMLNFVFCIAQNVLPFQRKFAEVRQYHK